MKRRIYGSMLAVTLLCGAPSVVSAQVTQGGARAAFVKGDNTIGFGLGFNSVHRFRSDATDLPAFSVHFDHGLINNVGPGTIGIGGVIGFQSSHYKYGSGSKANYSNFFVGFRGTYHLTLLKDKNNKFDPYGGFTAGIRAESYKNDLPGHNANEYGGAYPFFGPFVGAKYNFKPNFGAFAELGYDIAIFRTGLHLNF